MPAKAAPALHRTILAYIVGVLTGTVLAVLGLDGPADAITHTARLLHGLVAARPEGQGSMWRVVIVAEWQVALTYSAIVAAVAALLWFGLGRIGANRLWHALALGLVLGAATGAALFFKSADGAALEYLGRIAEFGLIGAASGLVEWPIGRPAPARAVKSSVT